MNKVVLGAAALVALILIAALAVPALVDWSRYRAEIATRLEAVTGHPVTIAGDVGLRLLPTPAFRAGTVTIGPQQAPKAIAERLDIRLHLLPLLAGRAEVDWLNVVGGALPGTPVAAINARIEAAGADGPFITQGSLRLKGVPLSFDGGLDKLTQSGGSPARLSLSVPGMEARAEFNGVLSELSGGRTLVGPLTVKIGDAARLVSALPAATPLHAEGMLSANAREASWKDLVATLGDTRATGSVMAGFDGRTTIDVKAAIASLDLDKWQARRPAQAISAPAQSSAPQSPAAPPEPARFSLPTDMFATLDLLVETLAWRGQVVRQAKIDAVLDQGEIMLQGATAQLPGGTIVSLAGTVTTPDGRPAFDGQAEARSDNPRAVLDWLDVDSAALPKEILRRFDGNTIVHVDPAVLRLTDLRMDLGGTALRGTASLSRGHVSVRASTGGLEMTATGNSGEFMITARHESFTQAVRLFAPTYRPAGTIGAFAASAKVAHGAGRMDITAINVKAGAARITGSASIDKGLVTADLASNAIDLDPFMPTERTGLAPGGGRVPPMPAAPPAAIPVAASPFGPDPLDLSILRATDARVHWRAEGVNWQGWTLDNSIADVAVKDGIATIDRLTGRLLGGDMSLTARLDANSTPTLTGAATIAGADMSQVKLGAGDIRVTQGSLNADWRFATAGGSSQDMAARLKGDGKLLVTDGIISGFDLAAVNQRLNSIENVGSLLGLAQAGLGGGQTRFSRLAGTVTAESGVLTSHDLKLDAQGGHASADATIRLIPWTIQSAIAIGLADTKAPPVVIRLDGPLGNPRKVVDINDIQQYLVSRGLGRALKGGESPSGKTNGPAILRELLKGFGGR